MTIDPAPAAVGGAPQPPGGPRAWLREAVRWWPVAASAAAVAAMPGEVDAPSPSAVTAGLVGGAAVEAVARRLDPGVAPLVAASVVFGTVLVVPDTEAALAVAATLGTACGLAALVAFGTASAVARPGRPNRATAVTGTGWPVAGAVVAWSVAWGAAGRAAAIAGALATTGALAGLAVLAVRRAGARTSPTSPPPQAGAADRRRSRAAAIVRLGAGRRTGVLVVACIQVIASLAAWRVVIRLDGPAAAGAGVAVVAAAGGVVAAAWRRSSGP